MAPASMNFADNFRLSTTDGQFGLVQPGPDRLPQHRRSNQKGDVAATTRLSAKR